MIQKYFIAIVPPEPVLLEIQQIKERIYETHQTKGALRSPGHITLHMPFTFDDNKEDKLVKCLNAFQFNTRFLIHLKNYDCFEPRVLFINVEEEIELYELQKQVVNHVKKQLNLFNQAESMRGFHPHVTVAFRDLKKTVFYKLIEEYQNKLFNANFTCQSFCLMKQQADKWCVHKEFYFSNNVSDLH